MLVRSFLRARIVNATVTRSEAYGADGISLDADLMDSADLDHLERVVLTAADGRREHTTCVLRGRRGGGAVELMGLAARVAEAGDKLVVSCWCDVDRTELASHSARLVEVDDANRPVMVHAVTPADEDDRDV